MWSLNLRAQQSGARALLMLTAFATVSCVELDGASPKAFGYTTPSMTSSHITVNEVRKYTVDLTFTNDSNEIICIDEDIVKNVNTFLVDVFLKVGPSFVKRRNIDLIPLTKQNNAELYPGTSVSIKLNLLTWYEEQYLEKFARSGRSVSIYIPTSDCMGSVSHASATYNTGNL